MVTSASFCGKRKRQLLKSTGTTREGCVQGMERVQSSVAWYQQKIGSYDKQLWEQSVEQKVKNLHQAPRRVVQPKTELIDVDLVRGSTFTKAKPQVPWTYITIKTFSRVVLFPFHYKWWIQQTSLLFTCFLMVLYTLQMFTIVVFFNNEQSLSEVAIPFILMVLLGLIHSQTVLTHLRPPVRDNKRDGWRRKRSLSQNRGSNSTEGLASGVTVVNDGGASPSQSRSSMKGHKGSRPLRERTKERRVRLKASNPRQNLRRDNNVDKPSQESDAAYHTLDASDSVPERASSIEHDSNESEIKGQVSRKNDATRKPEILPKVVVNGCEVTNIDFSKVRESQESDFPERSTSEDEKDCINVHGDDKSKRSSQSISSDNEDVRGISEMERKNFRCNGNVPEKQIDNVVQKNALEMKTSFEGVSVNVSIDASAETLKEALETNSESSFLNLSLSNSSIEEPINNVIDLKLLTNENSSQTSLPESANSPNVKQRTYRKINQKRSLLNAEDNTKSSPSSESSTVQFTADLVQLREITPISSRESTPTHTQSDCLLQAQRVIRGGKNLCDKTDTDTESENERSAKILPNRRRKVSSPVLESQSCDSTGLRNRRQPGLPLLEAKTNSMTAPSSSEGETEGHSSEYSRSGRRGRTASSDEWGDHLQSDVESTSEETSQSSPEISEEEHIDEESGSEAAITMTTSQAHAFNLLTSSTAVNSHPPDKVTCIIWERNECKKVELTALDIGWAIIETVDKIPESSDYILIGLAFSVIISVTPLCFVAFHTKDLPSVASWDIFSMFFGWGASISWKEMLIHINAVIQRFFLSAIFFFLLSVADRTFKQRLLYAKHFCYLTSSRRARKFDLPHLRLNKVRNIRTWLSLRSYLKRRGPQRSVDVIVSSAFMLTLSMLILMCLQLLREADTYLNFLVNWELLLWCMALGVYLLRFMTLGLRINKKYRNLSVLITEQINLYLQMEQKPHKKEELMVANNVLKLAESLLKELESPFKISGISANPLFLNVTKVVVLSAFSAVLTELLGFKLKLYKIKLRA
ncbi:protein PHTF2-like isoform X2 [Mya arenaria]|uniref:protein PHTF2-like isoform X2 n=1 Tax=Mya arenaria TaxID=6604 RepID=UPI0022E716D0|nr:protein PHTF2-like isoform X2 [Mya arenaria]